MLAAGVGSLLINIQVRADFSLRHSEAGPYYTFDQLQQEVEDNG